MSSAQDPFYIVKDEIHDSIENMFMTFREWERTPPSNGNHLRLANELYATCDSINWQVDELEKAIDAAASDPSKYRINEAELENRRKWTSDAHAKVADVKKSLISAGKESNLAVMRRELMRMPSSTQAARAEQYIVNDNEDYISSESDRQLLLIRQQDEELDELSASIERIGGVGLTIHEELLGQEKIIDDLGSELDNTSTRLDFVQKKVAMVMKKAGAKGQLMMICFLLILFIILFSLVFLT